MTTESLTATTTVPTGPGPVFLVLVDPSTHSAIDGTGWVREPVDGDPIIEAGQVFRMKMFNATDDQGHYRTANVVQELVPLRTISWATGVEDDEGAITLGGWTWRYDLVDGGDGTTEVRLTYDWSTAVPRAREIIAFPPFGFEHLERSLGHLADLATA